MPIILLILNITDILICIPFHISIPVMCIFKDMRPFLSITVCILLTGISYTLCSLLHGIWHGKELSYRNNSLKEPMQILLKNHDKPVKSFT